MDMNSVILVGRLAADVIYTPGTEGKASRAVGRLMVNRVPGANGSKGVDAIQIAAWGKHADNMAKYTSKGKELTIRGEIRTSYKKPEKDGEKGQNFFEVMVQHVSFGRDSTESKVMKALSTGGDGIAQEALAALGAGSTGGGSFAELLEQYPDLKGVLEGVASKVGPAQAAETPAEAASTEAEPAAEEADTPFSI